jgi:hypothetical protein
MSVEDMGSMRRFYFNVLSKLASSCIFKASADSAKGFAEVVRIALRFSISNFHSMNLHPS